MHNKQNKNMTILSWNFFLSIALILGEQEA